ncbi:hypothetical protein BKA70DRAFT_1425024 [Coprinopsis sp. MPI-PUGE-AT-0042]|nr:hypothetical protein BKA70DRAFT_1425024 [Coprinopsis sp. MPI-PUGE-AT-0042]
MSFITHNESSTRHPGTWVTTQRFRIWYRYQRRAQNIVVYCSATRNIVTIAWPLSSRGRRIQAPFIFRWLLDRGLTWSCFCQFYARGGQETPCQIGDNVESDGTGAFCHFTPSRCGFSMNLSRLYTEATLESEYAHLNPSIDDPTPQYQHFLQAFQEQHRDFVPGPDSDVCLTDVPGGPPTGSYFEGFCGTLFGDSPQIRANFSTHAFQRQLNAERRRIRQRRERDALVLTLYHNRPVGLGAQWDVLERAGITDEDFEEFYARRLQSH